ncbi:MAG: TonB-dependent receptor [Acidobacteriaceae bacterium]
MMMRTWFFVVCAELSLISASALPGQNISSSLRGTVVDPSGAAVANAPVKVLDASGKAVEQTVTGLQGEFTLASPPAGTYTLFVVAPGFRPSSAQFSLDGSRSHAAFAIKLRIAATDTQVTVSASEEIPEVSSETSNNQNANSFSRSSLDSLPLLDADYLTTLSALLDQNDIATGGVTLVVNGVEANGPGVTNSAIKNAKINQDPYSVLFSRPGRARIEITTESGTSRFHGSLNTLYRNSIFDAQNAFAISKPSEQRQYYEGSITGPVRHLQKTTFMIGSDYDLLDQQAFVNAATTSGLVRENVPNPTHHFFGFGRIFHDYAQGNQFWMGYSWEHRSSQNQGVGGTTLPEAGYNTLFEEHEINVAWQVVEGQHWLNYLHFLVGHYNSPTTSITEKPNITVQGAFTGGGAQADAKNTEYHFDGTDLVTYTRGKHTLQFGIDVPDISRRGRDDFTNTLGTYTFASLAAYEANQPALLLLQQGQGHLVFLEKNFAGFIQDTWRVLPNLELTYGARYYWQNYFHDDPNNLAPRANLTWAFGHNQAWVLRGGSGVFYDRTGPMPIGLLLHFNGINLRRYLIDNPVFGNPDIAANPTSVVTLAPHAIIPYTVESSIGIERQLGKSSTLSASWINFTGRHLFRSLDANAPPPPNYAARPDSALGQNQQFQSEGVLAGNALELTFRGRLTRFFTGQAQYRLSKTYNNTSGIISFPANSYDPKAEWSRADPDQRNRLNLLGTVNAGRWIDLGAILELYSGKPFDITTGADNNHDGVINDRPAGVPRNSGHGPAYANLDLNLSHSFVLGQHAGEPENLRIGLSSFDVFNHPNDLSYTGVITSPFFGHAVAAYPPRRMQVSAEFTF